MWSKLSELISDIATINITDAELFEDLVCKLFLNTEIPYSGVILDGDGTGDAGSRIEKSCYANGGYIFILREFVLLEEWASNINYVKLLELISASVKNYAGYFLDRKFSSVAVESIWAVCQRSGDYATVHHHIPPGEISENRISGIFYLRSPSKINPATFPNGCLYFIKNESVVYCAPVPGSLVLWPSKLLHGVHPFRGDGDRIGISFNAVLN